MIERRKVGELKEKRMKLSAISKYVFKMHVVFKIFTLVCVLDIIDDVTQCLKSYLERYVKIFRNYFTKAELKRILYRINLVLYGCYSK